MIGIKYNRLANTQGFTLIELVATIVILSILSVGVLPRFIDLSNSANLAITESIMSSFNQSNFFIQTSWMLAGRPQGASTNQGPTLEIDGLTIRVDPATGFPVGNAGADNATVMSLPDCITVFTQAVDSNYTLERRNLVTIANAETFDFIVSRTNANPDICNYYWSSSLSSIPNNGNPNQGLGLRYYPATGEVIVFNFL